MQKLITYDSDTKKSGADSNEYILNVGVDKSRSKKVALNYLECVKSYPMFQEFETTGFAQVFYINESWTVATVPDSDNRIIHVLPGNYTTTELLAELTTRLNIGDAYGLGNLYTVALSANNILSVTSNGALDDFTFTINLYSLNSHSEKRIYRRYFGMNEGVNSITDTSLAVTFSNPVFLQRHTQINLMCDYTGNLTPNGYTLGTLFPVGSAYESIVKLNPNELIFLPINSNTYGEMKIYFTNEYNENIDFQKISNRFQLVIREE